MLLGCSRTVAAEFSFFLAIPVMFGASLLKCAKYAKDIMDGEVAMITFNESIILLVGLVVAFLVSVLAIKFLMGYVKKRDFKPFGYYRIVLGIILLVYFFVERV
jgi:undecaprenyl-diphosphatase